MMTLVVPFSSVMVPENKTAPSWAAAEAAASAIIARQQNA
jgi:hypothetical protein